MSANRKVQIKKNFCCLNKFFFTFILFSIFFCPCAHSELLSEYLKENFNVYSEIGISPEPFGLGAEIGFSCFANDYISFRGGFFLLGGSEIENVYGGLNIATRLQLKNKFSPIIGFGLQAGYSEETDPVFDDKDIDNLILLFYPEFGLQFKFKGNYLITFTTRYNSVFTTEEEVVGSFWRFYFAVHLFGFFSLF